VTIVRLPGIACRSSCRGRCDVNGTGCVEQFVGIRGSGMVLVFLVLVYVVAAAAITDAQQGLNGGQMVVAFPKQVA
jgi:hypothetical protein